MTTISPAPRPAQAPVDEKKAEGPSNADRERAQQAVQARRESAAPAQQNSPPPATGTVGTRINTTA